MSYTSSFKLKVIAFAEARRNRAATREYSVNEANVRLWKSQKDRLKSHSRNSRAPGRGKPVQYPAMEKKVVDFIQTRRKEGCAVSTTVEVRQKALAVMKEIDGNSDFKASSNWCTSFMRRSKMSVRMRTNIAQRLPDDFEHKLVEYQQLVIKLRHRHGHMDSTIAKADQTPLTFDIPFNQTIDFTGVKSVSLRSTGNEKNRFTFMLGV